jgi:hypothetical protein
MVLRYARSIASVALALLIAVVAEPVMDPTTVEARVRARTAELEQSNQQLQEEIRERRRAEEASENLAGRLIFLTQNREPRYAVEAFRPQRVRVFAERLRGIGADQRDTRSAAGSILCLSSDCQGNARSRRRC